MTHLLTTTTLIVTYFYYLDHISKMESVQQDDKGKGLLDFGEEEEDEVATNLMIQAPLVNTAAATTTSSLLDFGEEEEDGSDALLLNTGTYLSDNGIIPSVDINI